MEYAHLKIRISNERCLDEVFSALRVLGFVGVNVTSPYKHAVVPRLDTVDDYAARIGAVNAIRIARGKLHGCNTDAIGARLAIKQGAGRRIEKGEIVVLFGTGGAAKAIATALIEEGAILTVFYRRPISPNTLDFKARFSGRLTLLPDDGERVENAVAQATIVCNATSAGMIPSVECLPFPDCVRLPVAGARPKLFFDAVYKPLHTRFLKEAIAAGHVIVDGLGMLLYQGAEAFRLWTGVMPSRGAIHAGEHTLRSGL